VVLLVVLSVMRRREDLAPGWVLAVFTIWYGLQRFGTDMLRAFDDRTLGLTGAQFLMIIVFTFGVALTLRLRQRGNAPQPETVTTA
jgi:prolipoprotein diacylglyceryltransferase